MNDTGKPEDDWVTIAELMAELYGIPTSEVYVKYYNNSKEDNDEQQQSNME
jgi:hypothetical protein